MSERVEMNGQPNTISVIYEAAQHCLQPTMATATKITTWKYY